ncbi:MAG: hypothetical protein K6T90_22655 [Leptolyngbyaceae cyanobacterium HOT.MB2.61]|nr:hypothetical protein [Leptolyngbyaceae cyanobacterium HOT.MB2.61]
MEVRNGWLIYAGLCQGNTPEVTFYFYLPHATCHLSSVTCHLSPATYHLTPH